MESDTPGISESRIVISGHFVHKIVPGKTFGLAHHEICFLQANLYYLNKIVYASYKMSGKHAKILSDHQLNCLLIFACNTRNPVRDKLIVLLSVKAGLRAGEIAKLTWDMVLDPTGEIGDVIELRDCAAKKNSGRLIPINPTLRAALTAWREMTTGTGPIIVSERSNAMRPVLSLMIWLSVWPCDHGWAKAVWTAAMSLVIAEAKEAVRLWLAAAIQ
jgi:integrase